jgi:hypothetical protein
MPFNRRCTQMNADNNREKTLSQSRPGRVPLGASFFRALPDLLICVHLRPSAVTLFFNHLTVAESEYVRG